MENFEEQFKEVRDEVIDCQKCSLRKTRTYPVIGQGDHQANIVFIGEAPGSNEDKTGRPFCGRAGGILDELLEGVGIKREDVYICNILKCRPPNNRDPLQDEITACTPYLEKQINTIRPQVIGTLGNYATAFILRKYDLEEKVQGISRLRGCVFDTKAGFGPVKIVPLYHPAVAVYNQNMKGTLQNDFKLLKQITDGEEIIF